VPEEFQRRGRRGGDAIYFDHRSQCRDPEHHRHCPGRWRGAVSSIEDGKRVHRKVSGRTKTEVKDRLKLDEELDQGVKPSGSYKVADALTDSLQHGLDGRSPWRSVRAHGGVKDADLEADTGPARDRGPSVVGTPGTTAARAPERRATLARTRPVFASTLGTPLDRAHVRRSLRLISRNAGIGEDWAPRDLRYTFVSIMSAYGEVPVEEIARLTGHSDIRTTETVYRHELRPVIRTGAGVMDRLLGKKAEGLIGALAG
jgi:Phage integrase family